MQAKSILNRKDILLILSILVATAGIWIIINYLFAPEKEDIMFGAIYLEGQAVKIVPLNIDQTFYVDRRPNIVFEVHNGAIAFVKSDCPDQVCVYTGFINSPWHFAACLPNFLVLSILTDDNYSLNGDNDIDIIVR
ncbi:MAG: NusG domain II-containing protein [Defluviitaleaceae bacterium]|nr:NusG domain II-containing protein [Defluviitaleaceae bacterium]